MHIGAEEIFAVLYFMGWGGIVKVESGKAKITANYHGSATIITLPKKRGLINSNAKWRAKWSSIANQSLMDAHPGYKATQFLPRGTQGATIPL